MNEHLLLPFPMEPNLPSCQKGLLDLVWKSTPPPFLLKTYMLVEDPQTDQVISWNDQGTAFVIWQPEEFARDLLPTLFKHSNFSSFVRQLNTYGFRKVATRRWEFCNEMFRRGSRELLCEIHRRKAWGNPNKLKRLRNPPLQSKQNNSYPLQKPDQQLEEDQRSSSTSSSSEYGNLVHENKRLKRENGALNSELTNMKCKCKKLTELVAKYVHRNEEIRLWGEEGEGEGEGEGEEEEEEKHKGPKLFGVMLLGVGRN